MGAADALGAVDAVGLTDAVGEGAPASTGGGGRFPEVGGGTLGGGVALVDGPLDASGSSRGPIRLPEVGGGGGLHAAAT